MDVKVMMMRCERVKGMTSAVQANAIVKRIIKMMVLIDNLLFCYLISDG